VIPRPLDELEQALPVASCFVAQPVTLPVAIPQAQGQEVRRSDTVVERIPVYLEPPETP